MDKLKTGSFLSSLVVLGALLGAPAASAAAFPPEGLTIASGIEAHCAVEVMPLEEAEADLPEPVCFDNEMQVEDYLNAIGTRGRGVAASTIVGTVYKDSNGTGSSLTFWGSSGCSGQVFGFSSLASGWDNSISSARGQNGCWVTLYTATSYGGSRLNCTPYCATISTWNDNVKSLVFRPTGTFG